MGAAMPPLYGTEPFFAFGFGHPSGGRFFASAFAMRSFQLPSSFRRSGSGPVGFFVGICNASVAE